MKGKMHMFTINGTTLYATRREAQEHAQPGDTIEMVASCAGYAIYYRIISSADNAE